MKTLKYLIGILFILLIGSWIYFAAELRLLRSKASKVESKELCISSHLNFIDLNAAKRALEELREFNPGNEELEKTIERFELEMQKKLYESHMESQKFNSK